MSNMASVFAMENGVGSAGSGAVLPSSLLVTATINNPSSVSSVLTLNTDGSLTASGVGNATSWYYPTTTGIGALFDVMIDSISSLSGTRSLSGPASGVWTQLNSNVTWSLTAPSSTVEIDEITYTLHIRRRADSVEVTTTSVDHRAETAL